MTHGATQIESRFCENQIIICFHTIFGPDCKVKQVLIVIIYGTRYMYQRGPLPERSSLSVKTQRAKKGIYLLTIFSLCFVCFFVRPKEITRGLKRRGTRKFIDAMRPPVDLHSNVSWVVQFQGKKPSSEQENCQFDAGKNDSVEFSITDPISLPYECWQFHKEIGLFLPTEHCAPLGLGLFTIICFPLRKL